MMTQKQPSGFTLVEIIVTISIMAIIGSLSSIIIGRSLDAYAALDRRQKLQSSIRLTLERISRELRHALPHSLCIYNDTAAACSPDAQEKFYFIPVKSSGRYQDLGNRYTHPTTGNEQRKRRLRIFPSDDQRLDVISTNTNNRLDAIGNVDTPPANNTGDWVVVYNINNSNIYQGTNNVRHQIHSITQKDVWNNGDPLHTIDYILFADNPPDGSPAQVGFANHSPTRRLNIIANDVVTLFYKEGRNLYRDTTTFANPQTPSGNQRILVENVEKCTFSYIPGGRQRADLLRIGITVEDKGERIDIIHEAHIYNVP